MSGVFLSEGRSRFSPILDFEKNDHIFLLSVLRVRIRIRTHAGLATIVLIKITDTSRTLTLAFNFFFFVSSSPFFQLSSRGS